MRATIRIFFPTAVVFSLFVPTPSSALQSWSLAFCCEKCRTLDESNIFQTRLQIPLFKSLQHKN